MTTKQPPGGDAYHIPVLRDVSVAGLLVRPDGTYLDVTLGGGGHSEVILGALAPDGRLICVDRDLDAIATAKARLGHDSRVHFVHGGFGDVAQHLSGLGIDAVDGILADLGVSSYQLDTGTRGFSFMRDGPLDLRMDQSRGETAADWLAQASEEEIAAVIYRYGEEKRSRKIARAIAAARTEKVMATTGDLVALLDKTLPPQNRIKSIARVFQALRIEVNHELDEIKSLLENGFARLSQHGRMVIIAYHSLEDRLVKTFFVEQTVACICPPELPVCVCGHKASGRFPGKKLITPSEEEIAANPRARSAKLRIFEKL